MGYVRDNGIGVDPERASMVKAIFALFDKGLSMQAIARYLNAIEYTTPRGKRWHASSVREIIIRRLVYQGANRGESPVTWPKIL